MRQWIGSVLVQIMACRLFGHKPLSQPIKVQNFSVTKVNLKILSAKWRPFCSWGDELKWSLDTDVSEPAIKTETRRSAAHWTETVPSDRRWIWSGHEQVLLQSDLAYPDPEYPETSPPGRILSGTWFLHYIYTLIRGNSRFLIRKAVLGIKWPIHSLKCFAKTNLLKILTACNICRLIRHSLKGKVSNNLHDWIS